MIITYNPQFVGDILMLIIDDSKNQEVDYQRHGDVARVFVASTNETVAWNIFNASNYVADLTKTGQIYLTQSQIDHLNELLLASDFSEPLIFENQPKLIIGHVNSLEPHPDSDHLNIAQVDIGEEILQIVAGAPNIAQGQKVVVCPDGSMLPNGTLIFSGELRGVKSSGMLASPRELSLPNAPQKRGILILPEATEIGVPFDAEKHWQG